MFKHNIQYLILVYSSNGCYINSSNGYSIDSSNGYSINSNFRGLLDRPRRKKEVIHAYYSMINLNMKASRRQG